MAPARTTLPRRRTIPKIARRLLALGTCAYVLSLVLLALFQRPLIFHAEYSRASVGAATKLSAGAKWVQFRAAGERVSACFGPALEADGRPDPQAAKRPTLLFFYGQGGSADGCRQWFESFRRLDSNVLMPDYVGFGRSGGQESEANCYATAHAAYEYLRARPDVDPNGIVIAGYSLGSAVASNLAARETASGEPVAGLILFAAFTSMAEEAHQEYPIYPTTLLRLLLRYPFASERNLRGVSCPTLLVHSRADRKIPFWMSDRLAAACRGPVTRLTVNRADHASYFSVDGKTVYFGVGQFLRKTNSDETQSSRRRAA